MDFTVPGRYPRPFPSTALDPAIRLCGRSGAHVCLLDLLPTLDSAVLPWRSVTSEVGELFATPGAIPRVVPVVNLPCTSGGSHLKGFRPRRLHAVYRIFPLLALRHCGMKSTN